MKGSGESLCGCNGMSRQAEPSLPGFGVVTRSRLCLWEWVAGVEWNKRQLQKTPTLRERVWEGAFTWILKPPSMMAGDGVSR